ncbi:MAG: hypothetical protein ABSD67_11430 [Terracidiphilus sp.]
MTRRILSAATSLAAVALFAIAIPHVGLAANNQNFSGKFLHPGTKGDSDFDPAVTLDVVQTDGAIEITRADPGGSTSNRYPLNGAEEDCVGPGGVAGKCKAQFKGKFLVLESTVISKDLTSGSTVHMRTVEQWQLSSDSKTLTIKVHVDFPDGHSSTSSEGQSSDASKYIRQ